MTRRVEIVEETTGHPQPPSWRLRMWLSLMRWGGKMGCHQMPERSFFFKGYQFPICARCTGVLPSTPLAAAFFFWHRISVAMALCLSAVMLLDWSLQYFSILESTNPRRFVTGIIGGFGVATLHMYFYQAVWHLALLGWRGAKALLLQ